jgi:UDP-N-acetylglucosamine 2-epimerase (non-hydrolysing)
VACDTRYSVCLMRIVYVVGAQPTFVKMAPVISELRRRIPSGHHTLIHTGQHYDRLMSDIFLKKPGAQTPDHMLGVGSANHAVQTERVIERASITTHRRGMRVHADRTITAHR